MTRKRYLCIKNFDELQHYKDRNPVWIKMPYSLLDDYEFEQLADETKFHAMGLMLLASHHNNKLPEDNAWLQKKIGAQKEIDLEILLEIGFLEVITGENSNKKSTVANRKIACKSNKTQGKSASTTFETALAQNRTEHNKKEQNTTQQNKRVSAAEVADTTDAEETAEKSASVVVCDVLDSFENQQSQLPESLEKSGGGGGGKRLPEVSKPEKAEIRVVSKAAAAASHSDENSSARMSKFSLEDCVKYVQLCQSKGEPVRSVQGLANHLYRTGSADASIRAALYPEQQKEIELRTYGAPREFSDEPCRVCYGARMEIVEGKGSRRCTHCRDEKTNSTGREPRNCPDHPPETDNAAAPNSIIHGDILKNLSSKFSLLSSPPPAADDG